MGLLDKFKKDKATPPIPQPENNSNEDFSKLNDVPQQDMFGQQEAIPAGLEQEVPTANDFKANPFAKNEMPKTELPEMEMPEEESGMNDLSLPSFDKEDANNIPDEVPFDDILAGKNPPTLTQEMPVEPTQRIELPETPQVSAIKNPQDKIFVKVSKYKNILKDFEVVKKELEKSKKTISSLTEDTDSKTKELISIKENLASIQQTMLDLDLQIFEN